MTADELAQVVADMAESNGFTREELALRLLGGPLDEMAQWVVSTRAWTTAERDWAMRLLEEARLAERSHRERPFGRELLRPDAATARDLGVILRTSEVGDLVGLEIGIDRRG